MTGTRETDTAGAPILSREPDAAAEDLPRGSEIPRDLDPLADGILMKHQVDWVADKSDLKLAEKGRRTGITFAEALDDTITAATSREDGGDNVFYIGDTKEKGREFIGYVAHFARIVAKELVQVEEFVFDDVQPDGTSRQISAYRVRFASGFRVEALSSRPENIRGLQGIVVIDEAAFHRDVRAVIDAVNALLIWGGKVRVISTHNGVLNPFNELVREARAGKVPFNVHFIPFEAAIENGLFRRVCLVKGRAWSQAAQDEWEAQVRGAYGVRVAAMRQELDAIPAEAEGAALTRVQIEACMADGIPVVRWACGDDFKDQPEHLRKAEARDFCERELLPILKKLNPDLKHISGSDFARSGDVSAHLFASEDRQLHRRTELLLEMRNVPFDQQREVLFYICDRLPRYGHGALDATGNGAYLAEVMRQRYGQRISEIKATADWYRLNSTAYVEAFGDRTFILPRDQDVLRDHQALQFVNGVIRVPENHRFKGDDGFDRHGDTAIAGIMAWFAARQDAVEYGYETLARGRRDAWDRPGDDEEARDWFKPPAGAHIRGSI